MKIFHPPLIPPIKGGKVPSPLVGEGLVRGIFVSKLYGYVLIDMDNKLEVLLA